MAHRALEVVLVLLVEPEAPGPVAAKGLAQGA